MRTGSPIRIALSTVLIRLASEAVTLLSRAPSMLQTQRVAWPWGSIRRGHNPPLSTITAFSEELRSGGRPVFCQRLTCQGVGRARGVWDEGEGEGRRMGWMDRFQARQHLNLQARVCIVPVSIDEREMHRG